MAKLLLIADTHFGVRQNSEHFLNNLELFCSKIFFPYLRANIEQIDGIVHLGDVFDDRRKIDINTAKRSKEFFFKPLFNLLNKHDKQMHIICGNHDSYYRDELSVTSLREFIEDQVYDGASRKPFVIHVNYYEIPSWNASFVPWITKTNRAVIEEHLAKTTRKYVFGHLELNGFNFSKVQVAVHGDDPQNFSKFNKVFSGHYHYPQQKDNIVYLGSPTEQTWIDVDVKRGFYIFDTLSGDLQFIENPYNIFENVKIGSIISTANPKFYRLYRNAEDKQSEVDDYVKKLYDVGAINVEIIIKNNGDVNKQLSETPDSIEAIEDTPIFIRNNVDGIEIQNILIDLYNRAIVA